MGYLFGSGNTDTIVCGKPTQNGGAYSAAARFSLASADPASKTLLAFRTAGTNILMQCLFGDGNAVINNQMVWAVTVGGAVTSCVWTTGFLANEIHTLVFTFDGTTMRLYADTDSTNKASQAVGGPLDTDAAQQFEIGNTFASPTVSFHGTIYEVGLWPGTVLTGAEAAAIGSGTPPATGPTDYWPLVNDAVALFGGHDGTVTGATVVAHSGANLYRAALSQRNIIYRGA
jgi:hypothetical protein